MTATDTTIAELDEAQVRVDLAAAFRLAARMDLHESVANHFSATVSSDGQAVPMQPEVAALQPRDGQ
jgi:hypothetical protein